MTRREVKFNTSVEVLDEVVVSPEWRGFGRQTHATAILPHWVKVRVGDEDGYLPEGALANAAAVQSAMDDVKPMAETARKLRKGFSEVEDDVALSTMKGAAGKQTLGAEVDAAKLKSAALFGSCETVDLRAFMFDGELEAVAYSPSPIAKCDARMPKVARGSGIDPALLAKFRQLKKILKDNPDPEIKLAFDAMQTMINKSFETLDPVREYALGEYVAARFISKYGVVDPEDERSAYVRMIGQTIAHGANGPSCFRPCRFILLDAPSVTNACAIAGGYIFVMSGILDFVQDEDELAGVLSHEMAHLELHHGMRHVGSSAISQLFSIAKDYAFAEEKKQDADFAKALDMVYNLMANAVENGYGAQLESEADWRAFQLAVRIGYDTSAFMDVLKRLRAANGSDGGAGYPKHRVEHAESFREGFGFDRIRVSGREARKARFERIMCK